MIKRKRKRKNPNIDLKFITSMSKVLFTGDPTRLADILIYYQQGEYCKDCDKPSRWCNCDTCYECRYSKCLCELGFTVNNFYDNVHENVFKTRLKAGKFAKKVLSNEEIELVKQQISNLMSFDRLNKIEKLRIWDQINEALDD